MAKKQIHERHDFFLRGVSLIDISVLNSVLNAQEKRNADLIAALEGAVHAVQEKCTAPELKKEVKKTLRSLRTLQIAQKSIPRLLRASTQAAVEYHKPMVDFADTRQFSVVKDDNILDLVQDFFRTLRVTVVQRESSLVLWNDTSKKPICSQSKFAARQGAVVHVCVNTAENPRVVGLTLRLAVTDGKPEVTAAAHEFIPAYGTYLQTDPKVPLTFARLRYRNETSKT